MATPRNFIVAMLIFCVFIVGGIFLITDFGINDSQTGEFNNTFYIVNNITGDIGNIRGSIESSDNDFGAFGVLNGLINSAWTSLKLLFGSYDIAQAVFDDAGKFLGIDATIVLLLGSIVLVIIAFAMWSAIFQRDL